MMTNFKAGKPLALVLLLVLVFPGCGKDHPGPPEKGEVGPGGIRLGMSRSEVIQAMLDDVQLLQMSGRVTNPYATLFLEKRDGEPLEVMYYYSGMRRGDDRVSEEELVPVILADNAVIGWGWVTLEEMTGSRPVPGK